VIRGAALLIIALAGSGCAVPEMHQRYEAERDVWRAQRDVEQLRLRPALAGMPVWEAMAGRFEALGRTYQVPLPAAPEASILEAKQTRALAARSFSRAAALRADLGDTAAALGLYQEVFTAFPETPDLVAGARLDHARLLESGGRTEGAITDYEAALAALPPRAGEPGAAGQVMQVPLHVARLRTAGDPGAESAVYGAAAAYYRDLADREPGTLNATEARSRLVDITTDRQDWAAAVTAMRDLEAEVLRCPPPPPEDLGRIRLGIAEAQHSGLHDDDAALATLNALLRDYPTGLSAALATLALARYHGENGDVDQALGLLDGMRKDFPDQDAAQAQALLYRARLLERAKRWNEALDVLRSIPIEYPLSDAALDAPLEPVRHYRESGDEAARLQALADAEAAYRSFLGRYPVTDRRLHAREKLIQVLLAEERYTAAADELSTLSQDLGPSPAGAKALWTAARLLEVRLGDRAGATELFLSAAPRFQDTPTAALLDSELVRLREGRAP